MIFAVRTFKVHVLPIPHPAHRRRGGVKVSVYLPVPLWLGPLSLRAGPRQREGWTTRYRVYRGKWICFCATTTMISAGASRDFAR